MSFTLFSHVTRKYRYSSKRNIGKQGFRDDLFLNTLLFAGAHSLPIIEQKTDGISMVWPVVRRVVNVNCGKF